MHCCAGWTEVLWRQSSLSVWRQSSLSVSDLLRTWQFRDFLCNGEQGRNLRCQIMYLLKCWSAPGLPCQIGHALSVSAYSSCCVFRWQMIQNIMSTTALCTVISSTKMSHKSAVYAVLHHCTHECGKQSCQSCGQTFQNTGYLQFCVETPLKLVRVLAYSKHKPISSDILAVLPLLPHS